MPVRINPASVIEARLGINYGGRAHAFFTETCYRYMDKYVPYSGDSGGDHLREEVDMQPTHITYQMPYAHAQYVGYTRGPVMNYTTPGTGPYWDKKMVSAEMNDVVREVEDYIKYHGGN